MKDQSLEEFLSSVAAATPTPGGGTVSAIAGALGVALARMVAGLARGKAGYEEMQEDLARLEERGARLEERLLALAEKDSAAYQSVVSAMHLPRANDAEKSARVEALQAAYRRATEVPLETMEACVEAIEIAALAVEKGNRSATTDAAVAILLAEAGLRGASLNARINLASIKDEAYRATVESKMDRLLSQADVVGHRAMAIAEGRL